MTIIKGTIYTSKNVAINYEKRTMLRKGFAYYPATVKVNGETANVRLVYDAKSAEIVSVNPKQVNKKTKLVSELAKDAISNTSGRWSKEGMTKPVAAVIKARIYQRQRHYVLPPEDERRAYNPTVYFHLRRVLDQNDNVVGIKYCYSHKLINADPMGDVLLERFFKNPEKFVRENPQLCSANALALFAEFHRLNG